mmetsp:Transcript_19543/g.27103  ORF Transcript_19543/g.27103 Transcript_19543/m.27103 type:complete len:221 (+) Transcript_19543:114-776(+)
MAPPTPAEVTKLLATQAYSPDIVSPLADYARAQAEGQVPYHFDANRTLVKLYTFFPHLEDENTIAIVLLLSLIQFPSTDTLALSYMIPDRVQTREPCATIMSCAELLDSCQFEEFWNLYNSKVKGDDAILQTLVQSSAAAIQTQILHVMAQCYKVAPLATVERSLDTKKIAGDCVDKIEGGQVYFKASADNTKRNRVFQEGVNFQAISNMMISTTTAAVE